MRVGLLFAVSQLAQDGFSRLAVRYEVSSNVSSVADTSHISGYGTALIQYGASTQKTSSTIITPSSKVVSSVSPAGFNATGSFGSKSSTSTHDYTWTVSDSNTQVSSAPTIASASKIDGPSEAPGQTEVKVTEFKTITHITCPHKESSQSAGAAEPNHTRFGSGTSTTQTKSSSNADAITSIVQPSSTQGSASTHQSPVHVETYTEYFTTVYNTVTVYGSQTSSSQTWNQSPAPVSHTSGQQPTYTNTTSRQEPKTSSPVVGISQQGAHPTSTSKPTCTTSNHTTSSGVNPASVSTIPSSPLLPTAPMHPSFPYGHPPAVSITRTFTNTTSPASQSQHHPTSPSSSPKCTTTFSPLPTNPCATTYYDATRTLSVDCLGCVGEHAKTLSPGSPGITNRNLCQQNTTSTVIQPFSTRFVCACSETTSAGSGFVTSSGNGIVSAVTAMGTLSSGVGGTGKGGNWTGGTWRI
ncbi:hypothetical protein Q7P37_006937 [Cladosporium fusiforme]